MQHSQSDSQPSDPTTIALRRLIEARRILEEIVTSSESFDYHKAKLGLKQLQRMIRELSKEEARLQSSLPPRESSKIVPFTG